ncbi:MAG: hypothetical protein LQ351_007995 [Letrouitia transgressa]|nr:MAG: hypothetical protein LQ351_007995 [Letrouitia transgressa]
MADSNTSSGLDLGEPKGDNWWGLSYFLSKTGPNGQFCSLATALNFELLPMADGFHGTFVPPGFDEVIIKWKLRGIWDDKWDRNELGDQWKHEYMAVPQLPQGANLEQRVQYAREIRELNASRPINMFFDDWLEQIKETVKKNDKEYTLESDLTRMIQDSYHFVKDRWVKHQIWTKEWKVLPSDKWRHETTPLGPEPRNELTMTEIDSNASTITESLE